MSIEFNSHPDFPSFKSITDSLDHFNIESLAASIPKEQFKNIDQPVLVNIISGGKSHLAVAINEGNDLVKLIQGSTPDKELKLSLKNFSNIWDGSLIAIEANSHKKSVKPSKLTILFTVLALLVLAQSISNGFNSSTFIYSCLAVAGVLLSYLVIQISIDPKTQNSKFCTLGKSTDCNTVINSASSKFIGSLSLSDLSIIYFLAISLALLLTVNFSMLAWVSVLTLPAIAYSIYRQGLVLKKWCPLCLGIGLTLGLQFTFSFSYLSLTIENDLVLSLAMLALSFTSVTLAWFQLKPVLKEKKEMVSIKQELRSFKRNYHLFTPYFQTLPKIDTTISANDIRLGGNPNAPVKILGITNPLCKHCFDVHKMLERILEKHPNRVSIDLRFLVPTQNSDDSTVLVAAGMLKAFKEEGPLRFKQIMTDWYKNRDIKQWLAEVGVEKAEDQYLEILNDHRNWCAANGIGGTPITLVNNRMFPHFYESTDLENMIEGLIEHAETNEIRVEKEELQPT
ncbi:vitamin K epoxide reductase family protein [Roseivirga echinicomitans]